MVPLMHYDLSDPRSLILIWIIPMECSLRQCQAQTCPARKKERFKVDKEKKAINHVHVAVSLLAVNLPIPAYKTSTLQPSYFVHIVKLWNNLCNEAFPSGFTSLGCFKSFLKNLYKSLLMNVFDMGMVCSWSISPKCSCH